MELTGKEKSMIELILKGYTNSQIAEEFQMSPDSAKVAITRIYKKFNLQNQKNARVRLVVEYYRNSNK